MWLGETLMETNGKIIMGALKECMDRSDIEDVFGKFNIDDKQERINYLLEVMGDAEMFYSIGSPSLEQRYELVVQMFLTMTWKYDD